MEWKGAEIGTIGSEQELMIPSVHFRAFLARGW